MLREQLDRATVTSGPSPMVTDTTSLASMPIAKVTDLASRIQLDVTIPPRKKSSAKGKERAHKPLKPMSADSDIIMGVSNAEFLALAPLTMDEQLVTAKTEPRNYAHIASLPPRLIEPQPSAPAPIGQSSSNCLCDKEIISDPAPNQLLTGFTIIPVGPVGNPHFWPNSLWATAKYKDFFPTKAKAGSKQPLIKYKHTTAEYKALAKEALIILLDQRSRLQ